MAVVDTIIFAASYFFPPPFAAGSRPLSNLERAKSRRALVLRLRLSQLSWLSGELKPPLHVAPIFIYLQCTIYENARAVESQPCRMIAPSPRWGEIAEFLVDGEIRRIRTAQTRPPSSPYLDAPQPLLELEEVNPMRAEYSRSIQASYVSARSNVQEPGARGQEAGAGLPAGARAWSASGQGGLGAAAGVVLVLGPGQPADYRCAGELRDPVG